jgi:structural maintenance of chromosome 4
LEQIYEDMKGVTQKLRSELEQKTQELAPVNQERACFQADLDTAETEVKLLEDSTTRAKKNLGAAEEELATLDQKQESKSSELKAGEDELIQSKARIVDAQAEEKVLAEKEGSISKRNQQLLVS